ncbi:hypothetical protein CRYUN_Cryun10bG0042400 [Craigia yunnanensis]
MSALATSFATNVFGDGSYATMLINNTSSLPVPPPKPLLIATPSDIGEFPLLIFLHGYLLYNYFYSQLLQQVASHGFIVIAPQLYTWAGQNATDEIISAAAITNWLSKGVLKALLPPDVQPNLSKLGLAGHSREGKVAFALALKNEMTKLKFSALIGVDPVDGMGKGKQTIPPVLTFVNHSFNLDMPVMVIGSGLGPLFPACAPNGVNHVNFFEECKIPACHFVANDYGHLDMLDDDTEGLRGVLSYILCRNGKAREPMRRFVGGVVVAFMNAYLNDDDTDLIAIRDGHVTAPVTCKTMKCSTLKYGLVKELNIRAKQM